MSELLPSDLAMFERLRIPADLIAQAGIVRVSDREAREKYGLVGPASMDMSGVCFGYIDPLTGVRHTCRVRRDNPDSEGGKARSKYVAPYGDKRHLYFVPGCGALVHDVSVPVVLIESEKAALSLTAWSERNSRKILPVAMGGCWGWRGRIGKVDGPKGQRIDEKGALPELALICSKHRDVFVFLDSNANHNTLVRAARGALCRELLSYGARVLVATIPVLDANGPDDVVAKIGDSAITSILELATPALDLAVADAEAIIDKIKKTHPNLQAEDMRQALDVIADVTDEFHRQVLQCRLADAVRGVVPKKLLVDEVHGRRKDREQKQEDFATENRRAELRQQPLDAERLICDLEEFFSERAFLPDGAGLACAYFALNTWVFDLFDATPYVCLESAMPRCGKSTMMKLLAAVSYKGLVVTSMNEPIFRLIHQERPTLCVDEAEALEGRTDRAEALRTILNEGYKRGGRVPRCVGEEHQVQFFEVYSPKIFAVIGGLSGALLDRCLIIHMQRAPRGSKRKSTRIRAVARDSKPLIEKLEVYAVKYRDELKKLYDAEPDQGYWPGIIDREAELWGPLLTHARLIGVAAEARLLKVVQRFSQAKDEIEAQDAHNAKAIALLDALKKLTGDTFSPAHLVEDLSQTDAWSSTFAKAKGNDDKTRERTKAVSVGFVLRRFRLRPQKKSSSGSSVYSLTEAINVIGSHVPQNLPYPPEVPGSDRQHQQVPDDTNKTEGPESTEGFTDAGGKAMSESDQCPNYCRVHGDHTSFWRRPAGEWVCAKCHPPVIEQE